MLGGVNVTTTAPLIVSLDGSLRRLARGGELDLGLSKSADPVDKKSMMKIVKKTRELGGAVLEKGGSVIIEITKDSNLWSSRQLAELIERPKLLDATPVNSSSRFLASDKRVAHALRNTCVNQVDDGATINLSHVGGAFRATWRATMVR